MAFCNPMIAWDVYHLVSVDLEGLSLLIAFEILSNVITTVFSSCVKFLSSKSGIGSDSSF